MQRPTGMATRSRLLTLPQVCLQDQHMPKLVLVYAIPLMAGETPVFSTCSQVPFLEPFCVKSRNGCSLLGNPSENTLPFKLHDLVDSCIMHLEVFRCHHIEPIKGSACSTWAGRM